MSDESEVSEWSPSSPRLKQIGDILRNSALYRDTPLKGLMEPTANLLEMLSYGDRLTSGKNQTLNIKPEALEGMSDLSNLIPGKAMASIGPIGLRRLGDAGLWKKYLEIKNELGKTKPNEWKLQKEIVESNPGWFAVPRGRDADPTLPHVKYGYEIPEAKLGGFMDYGSAKDALKSKGVVDLPDLVDSPRHYAAYPELSRYSVTSSPELGRGAGRFRGNALDIEVGTTKSEQNLLDILNHELEHFVQRKEGWPGGTSPSYAGQQLGKINSLADLVGEEALPRELQKQSDVARLMRAGNAKDWAHVEYRRAAGEQMAEAAAKSAAKGGGFIPRSFTSTPSLMYDPNVQARSILELTKKLDEAQYRKDLASEFERFMK